MKTQEENDPGVITDIMGQEPFKEVESEEQSKEVESAETVEPTADAQEKKEEPGDEKKEEEKEKEEEEEKIDWEARALKLEKERNNYKEALLIAKGKTLSLGGIKKTEEDKSKWDETSDEFQKETLTKVQQQVQELLEKRNEQGAIKRFYKKHPSVILKGGWNDVVESYKASRGRGTVEDILEDLEDAYLVSKRKNGTLKEDLEKAKQEGERKGIVKTKTAQMASVSGAGNHSVTKTDSKKGVSDSAKYMAQRMKTPLDKLEQEDDSVTTSLNSI